MQSTFVSDFKINKMTKSQYTGIVPNANEVYITTDEADAVLSVNGTLPNSSGNVTISIPTESTVSGWGFTKNVGTVTSVNNVSPVSGNVTLSIPTVGNGTITIAQDSETQTFTTNQNTNQTINVKGLYDYYVPNLKITGSPTINSAVMSGFSNSNYAQMRETLSFGVMPWEWWVQFTTGTIPTLGGDFQYIIYGSGIQLYLDAGNPGSLGVTLGSNSTSFGSLSANTTYKVRIMSGADKDFNSASVSNIYLYDENDNLLASTSINSLAAQIITPYYGVYYTTSASLPFDGSIDFTNTYINEIDTGAETTTLIWTGKIPIINTKADSDLANVSSISSSSEVYTQLAGKAVTSLTNTTAAGDIKMAETSYPSDLKRKNLTLGASGTTYTATSSGWVMFSKTSTAAGQRVRIITRATGDYNTIDHSCWSTASGQVLSVSVPVLKGQTFGVYYDSSSTTNQYFRFTYAVGSESEAS